MAAAPGAMLDLKLANTASIWLGETWLEVGTANTIRHNSGRTLTVRCTINLQISCLSDTAVTSGRPEEPQVTCEFPPHTSSSPSCLSRSDRKTTGLCGSWCIAASLRYSLPAHP